MEEERFLNARRLKYKVARKCDKINRDFYPHILRKLKGTSGKFKGRNRKNSPCRSSALWPPNKWLNYLHNF